MSRSVQLTHNPKPKPARRPRPAWLPSPPEAKLRRAIQRAFDNPERLDKVRAIQVAQGQFTPRSQRRRDAIKAAKASLLAQQVEQERGERVYLDEFNYLYRLAWNLTKIAAIATACLLAACGCGPCGGEIALVRRPGHGANYLPQSTLIQGPGSASVPFRIESPPSSPATELESIPPPAIGDATTATSGESPQPRWR